MQKYIFLVFEKPLTNVYRVAKKKKCQISIAFPKKLLYLFQIDSPVWSPMQILTC